MKKVLVLLLAFSGSLFAKPIELSNSKLKVVYDQRRLSFYANSSTTPYMKEVSLEIKEAKSAQVKRVKHPIFGEGSELTILDELKTSIKVSLYESIPFVMIQKSIKNSTSEEQKISKLALFEGQVSLGVDPSKLNTASTAGLRSAVKSVGSYMYLAVGNPKNNEGVVCAWLTANRGSGIVSSTCSENQVVLKAHIDYGDLRLPVGKTEESEILLVGYGFDVRTQLEAYADAIALNMKIKLHPQPTIYCTWYHANASSEKKIAANTDFAVEHLKPYSLSVMQIDDKWQSGINNNGPSRDFSNVNPKGPYPSGMKKSADYIMSKGMTAGIWYIPFAGSWYDEYWKDKLDLFLKEGDHSINYFEKIKMDAKPIFEKGKIPYDAQWGGTCLDLTNPKTIDYVSFIANLLSKEWGYKYFKMDGLWTGTGTCLQYVNTEYKDDDLGTQIRFNPLITPIEGFTNGFNAIRKSAGNDVFLLGCCAPQNMRSFGPTMGRVDAMRIGPDNGATPNALTLGPQFGSRLFFLNKRVWYNDPDPGYPRIEYPLEMAQTALSWISLSGSLHGTSEQYANLPKESLDLLRKSMPSHNLKSVRPVDFLVNDIPTIWYLTDKRDSIQKDVIGLFNFDIVSAHNISCSLKDIELPKADRYVGYDFWSNRFIPPFSGSISCYINNGACHIISIRPERNYPQVLSTSRHLTQGVIDLTKEKWSGAKQELSGTSEVISGDAYELRVVVPCSESSWLVDSIMTYDPTIESSFTQYGSVVLVKIKSEKAQNVNWNLHFKKGVVRPVEASKVVLNATTGYDQIVVKWNNTTPYQYRLLKNGELLGEVYAESFIDNQVNLGMTYKYGVQAKSEDGKWSEVTEATATMPTSYETPATPQLPDVFCVNLKPLNGSVKTNLTNFDQAITMDGVVQSNAMGCKPSSKISYAIPKNSKRFVTTVVLESREAKHPNYKCSYVIFGDVVEMGEAPVELGRSPELNSGDKWNFDIKLDSRFKQIKISSIPNGTFGQEVSVNWINAGFLK